MVDQLNYFEYEQAEIEEELKKYFRKMPDITEEQVEERKDVALDVFFLMLFFMSMVKTTEITKQYQDLDYYIEMLGRRYEDIVYNRYGYSQSLSEYAPIFARSVVNTTFSSPDDENTLSVSRAVNIAENEANTIVNEADYHTALENGKTHKKWITERDERVRKTHKAVDGKVLPIKEYYTVGDSRMLYAHDAVNGSPSQVIGCRCHMEYLNKGEEPKDNKTNFSISTDRINGDKYPSYSSRNIQLSDTLQKYNQLLKNVSDVVPIDNNDLFDEFDMVALTIENNCEYALFNINGVKHLVRGNELQVPLSKKFEDKIYKEKGIWECHTHAFRNNALPSDYDRNKLETFTWQKESKIIDEDSTVCIFTKDSDIIVKENKTNSGMEEFYNNLFGD